MSYVNRFRYLLVTLILSFYFPVYATTTTGNNPVSAGSTASTGTTSSVNCASKQQPKSNSERTTSQPSALTVLEKMHQAIDTKNYELVFINGSNIGFETMLYSHGILDKHSVSQLIYMEGLKRVILQEGNSVSYFEQNSQSYSLHAKHIVDGLPAIFYTDFKKLASYYDFSVVGYGRAANKDAILVRILDKQHERYSQLIWIDQASYLPLRIDYIDNNGQTIEQFKVAQEKVLTTLPKNLQDINSEKFPPLLPTIKNTTKISPMWQASWLPQGFTLRSCNSEANILSGVQHTIESCYFSDGIYSFTLNISSNPQGNVTAQNLIKGMRLIHIETDDGHQVVFIGNLPINTADKIIQGLNFTH